MSAAVTLSPGAELFVAPGPFALEHDREQPELALAYESSGPEDEPAGAEASGDATSSRCAPVVVVQGGISSNAHVASTPRDPTPGWWEPIVGPGRAIDPRRVRVLALDFVGRREDAVVSSGDQARATALLLDELRVERVHAFVGASYGGMVALKFAELFPERVERVIAISAADRPRVFATAWRALQRRVLALGERHGAAGEAVVLARAMGMLSYRSAAEFEERFAPGSPVECPVEDYLLARGRDFAARFEAGALARLSRAIDLHRCDVGRIRARTTLVAADPDLLVPAEQLARLAPRFGRPARFVRIASRFGHDAFLKEVEPITRVVADALEDRS
jgi:homoserine O-acetyltransferase